jgi:FkbM family methyltransferase
VAIKSNLSPGSTFFDIGAWVGWFTLFASKIVGPLGQVYSFEPPPDVYARLSENVGLKNVPTLQYGIGNKDGELEFASQGDSSSASFIEAVTEINKHSLPDTPIRKTRVGIRKIPRDRQETPPAGGVAGFLHQNFDHSVPSLELAVIDLAEIQHRRLHHLATGAMLVLDNIPEVAMPFAVFEASVGSQEHDTNQPYANRHH